jgi:hypothetical protein
VLYSDLVVSNLTKEKSMPKLKLLLLVGLAVSLAACNGQAPAKPTVAPTVAVAPTAVKTLTVTAPAATRPSTPAAAPKLDPAGMCKATSFPKPVPNFPASLPTDQSQGSDKAPVTLYEYSDFQ